ncbi:MAG: Holliday junction branch migration protein RuvA [Polyangiales bacterium]
MIGRLTGIALDQGPDGCCVLDVQGVGYEVFVPLRTLSRLPSLPNAVTLHVHTHVREDMLRLYGFESVLDRAAFRLMLGVSGVGPKLAMAILNELSAAELSAAVGRGDKQRFAKISGIGKKTAERLVMELKDKLPALSQPFGPGEVSSQPLPQGRAGEVAGALVALGFTRTQAESAAHKVVAPDDEARPLETLVRKALSTLG